MIDTGIQGDAAIAVAALTLAVADLLGVPLTSLPGTVLVEVAHLVETQLRRMAVFDHSLVAALVGSAVHAEVGARSTSALLAEALRLSPGDAATRVRAARELGPRVDFTGAPMQPLYADVAGGQAAGVLSPAHARVVTGAIHKLPTAVTAEHGAPLERFLVDQAREHAPGFVAKAATHAVAVLDPDGGVRVPSSGTRTARVGMSQLRRHTPVDATLVDRRRPNTATQPDSSHPALRHGRSRLTRRSIRTGVARRTP